jgi:hypothetical protein
LSTGHDRVERLVSLIRSRVCVRIAAACGALSIVSCSVATQDSAKPNDSFKVIGPETNCIQKAAPVIEQFFDGKAKPDELSDAWDCASDALQMFTKLTQGKESDNYQAKEVRSFFETYFLGDIKITDGMLNEVMRLKQTILGGSIDTITRAEIARTQNILQSLKVESLRLLPYMDIITMKVKTEDAQQDPNRVESALIVFNTSMENIGNLLGQSGQAYESRHLENLMRELKTIYSTGNRHWDGPQYVLDNMGAITALKAFMIKPPANQIAPTEWQPLLVNCARLFSLYIRSEYMLKSRDLLSGEGLDQLTVAVYEIFDIIQGSIQAKPNKVIEYQEWDDLVNELLRLKVVDLPIKASTMRQLVRTTLGKVFNPPVNGKRPVVAGLSMTNFLKAREGIFGWIDMQRVWREVQAQAYSQEPRLRGGRIPIPTVRELWAKARTPFKGAHQDIDTMLSRTYPLVYTDEGAVIFGPQAKMIGMDQGTFNTLNWKTHFARIVGMGWAADPEKNRYLGLTKPEFKAFYLDAKDLAEDLEFLDPTSDTIWDTTFDESNMFMLSGDANSYLSFSEGVDFISYALSSSVTNGPIYDDGRALCAHEGKDYFGWPKINYACIKANTVAKWNEKYKNLPSWQAVAKKIGTKETAELFDLILMGSRSDQPVTDPLEIADVNRMTMLMHYIESLYTRFDRDLSGTISFQEARDVYPIFYDLLKEAAKEGGITKESEIYALYNYILYKGKPPESIIDKVYFKLIWCNSPSKWEKVDADRVKLAQIVGQLATVR